MQMSDKGKGKGKKPQGHTLPKTRLSAEKFSGVVTAWKGRYGWIKPGEEIEHEKASMNGGALFVSVDDVMDGSGALHPGAPCEFHITEDEKGLGAEEVVETGPPDPSAIPADKGKGKGGGKSSGKEGKAPASNGWGGDKGYGKAPSKAYGAAAKGWSEPYGGGAKGAKGKDSWGKDPWGKDSWGGGYGGKGKDAWGGGKDSYGKGMDPYGKGKDPFGKGKDKGDKGKKGEKGGGKYGGKGHLLPRTRITAEKFQGTVSAWKGKFGWITPAEEIEHEKAKNHKAGLFVSKDDLEGGIKELTPGATVEFHIWEDDTGLGAEEVVQH